MGQSQMTLDKQDGLTRILRQHISTVKVILGKSPWAAQQYHYIDLTAGCGHNELVDCDGSPVIFEKVAKQSGIPYTAHFIDIDEANTMILSSKIKPNGHRTIHTGDHTEIAPDIVQDWPNYTFGLIYVDPNGVPPFALLADLSKNPKLARVDFLIRYTGSGVKRAGYKLLDELSAIQKQHWIVRDLDEHDRWQWTFLLGLNWGGLNTMKGQGFHYASSPKGEAIINRLHYTKPELEALHQPMLELPYTTYDEYLAHPNYKAIRAKAIDRSGGICERCKIQAVTEVHHVEYPPWGTFETDADSLLALCHKCHCKIHGKEN